MAGLGSIGFTGREGGGGATEGSISILPPQNYVHDKKKQGICFSTNHVSSIQMNI